MKTLIIVRHGYYEDGTGNLTTYGQQQIKALANMLKDRLNGDKAKIVSSSAPRAEQSAKILSESLGIGFKAHNFLWSGSDSCESPSPNLNRALELIKGLRTKVVIVVTHFEYSAELPRHFGSVELDTQNFPRRQTEKGEAWVIDCKAKTCTRIVPTV